MKELENIKVQVCDIVADSIKDKTFVVRAKRTGIHLFNSSELERTVGGYILAHSQRNNFV